MDLVEPLLLEVDFFAVVFFFSSPAFDAFPVFFVISFSVYNKYWVLSICVKNGYKLPFIATVNLGTSMTLYFRSRHA